LYYGLRSRIERLWASVPTAVDHDSSSESTSWPTGFPCLPIGRILGLFSVPAFLLVARGIYSQCLPSYRSHLGSVPQAKVNRTEEVSHKYNALSFAQCSLPRIVIIRRSVVFHLTAKPPVVVWWLNTLRNLVSRFINYKE